MLRKIFLLARRTEDESDQIPDRSGRPAHCTLGCNSSILTGKGKVNTESLGTENYLKCPHTPSRVLPIPGGAIGARSLKRRRLPLYERFESSVLWSAGAAGTNRP